MELAIDKLVVKPASRIVQLVCLNRPYRFEPRAATENANPLVVPRGMDDFEIAVRPLHSVVNRLDPLKEK